MGSTHETPGRFAPGESGIVGVFGMDLEGLEVVSGCSKRFIWKLTDISMNSCVDLLSPPAWWCGLKLATEYESKRIHQSPPAWWCGLKFNVKKNLCAMTSHHLRGGVDWNNGAGQAMAETAQSPPAWWCGLKYKERHGRDKTSQSPPAWWCGLKFVRSLPPDFPLSSPPAWWCGLKFLVAYMLYLTF